jgi:hypothetical protein
MLPKRRFWKDEQKMKCGFSMEFSTIRSPNRVLTPLKTPSNIRILSCVHPSKIFVWEFSIRAFTRGLKMRLLARHNGNLTIRPRMFVRPSMLFDTSSCYHYHLWVRRAYRHAITMRRRLTHAPTTRLARTHRQYDSHARPDNTTRTHAPTSHWCHAFLWKQSSCYHHLVLWSRLPHGCWYIWCRATHQSRVGRVKWACQHLTMIEMIAWHMFVENHNMMMAWWWCVRRGVHASVVCVKRRACRSC